MSELHRPPSPDERPPSSALESTPGKCPLVVLDDGTWAVRGHADVLHVATTPEVFSSGGRRHLHVPNGMDGAEHRRFRDVVDRHLDDSRILPLAGMITQACDQAATDLLEPGTAVEVVHDYGRHVAVRVQCQWLGWPESLEEELLEWIDANFAATRSGDSSRNSEVAAWFDRIVTDLVTDRRQREAGGGILPNDPTTLLLHDTVADPEAPGGTRPLTDAELVSMLRNWTAGDLGSIAACVGVVIHHVATRPEEQQRLRDLSGAENEHADELDAAVDEMLRLNDPFPSNRRMTLQDSVLAGYRVPAGTPVVVNWTAANRDERVFPDPDAYRPAEHRADNIVYGAGPHICPGRVLSTLQIRGALAALLRATTSIELDPVRPPKRYPFPSRGFDTVPVVLR